MASAVTPELRMSERSRGVSAALSARLRPLSPGLQRIYDHHILVALIAKATRIRRAGEAGMAKICQHRETQCVTASEQIFVSESKYCDLF